MIPLVRGRARAGASPVADDEAHDVQPAPPVAPTIAPTTVAASNCRSAIATAPTPSLLKANYSSMEDAYDNVQHGHATYECAEILIEELKQYDKAEPYLWCVLDHCAGCDVNGMCPTAYLSLETTSKCESAVWNYLGFVNRKKATPDYDHARVLRQGPGAVARELWGPLLHDGALPDEITRRRRAPRTQTFAPAAAARPKTPSRRSGAARRRRPRTSSTRRGAGARRFLDAVLMVLSLVVIAACLVHGLRAAGCGRDQAFPGGQSVVLCAHHK